MAFLDAPVQPSGTGTAKQAGSPDLDDTHSGVARERKWTTGRKDKKGQVKKGPR